MMIIFYINSKEFSLT